LIAIVPVSEPARAESKGGFFRSLARLFKK
jgi:hypothetical protein